MTDKQQVEDSNKEVARYQMAAVGLILGAGVGFVMGDAVSAGIGAGVGLVLGAAIDTYRQRSA